jgi:hypothetical protein
LRDPVAKTAILSPFKLLDYYVEADADILVAATRRYLTSPLGSPAAAYLSSMGRPVSAKPR